LNHIALDQYCDRDSIMHRLDARTKLLFALLFIFVVVSSPSGSWFAFVVYFVVISSLILVSRLPIGHVLKRSLAIVPFVIMIAIFVPFFREGEIAYNFQVGMIHANVTYEGILVLETILIKAWLSILSLIWLTSVTRVTSLLRALRRLHFPGVLVMIISFMYRYLFVIVDETLRMKQARDCRSFGGNRLRQLRSIGSIIGTLFVRSYERSERVYFAMAARGFDGETRTLDGLVLKKADIVFGACLYCLIISVAICNIWVLRW
jgi:cobalt/nickel transport system permease protein